MASISSSSSSFDESDRYLIRLRKMSESGSTKALLKVLRWVNPKWKSPVSFKEYIKNEKKVKMKELQSTLKPHQRRILNKDPQGDTYDISLLFTLISWANEGLANKENNIWHKKSTELEYLITAVKNTRNDLMHCYEEINAKKFLQMTEDIRSLLEELYTTIGSKYSHVTVAEIDSCVQDMNLLINRIRDDHLDPKDFAEYKKQLLFSQQCNFLRANGIAALKIRHSRYSTLTPVSHLVKRNFPVGNVFTDMLVRQGANLKEKINLEDLLEVQNDGTGEGIILLVGDAGIGKTTLTKMCLNDWVMKKNNIKHLDTYDLIIHAECREHIESFKHLLDCSMPEVSKSFQGDDIVFVTMALKVLIIVDGFDEVNQNSMKLFKEILKKKKDYDITILVTSRPEAVEKYFQLARIFQIETKHIELLGIPEEKREEFVRKYFDGIDKTGGVTQEVDGLLKYLKRTFHRLGYLWRSPYNLCILTILWTLKPDVVNSITTAPELHWEIHQLSLSKLKERLVTNDTTQHLSDLQMDRNISSFLYKLCRESLVAIVNDNVTLPQEAYQRLVDICHEIYVPAEEMIGAFLKKVSTESGIRYSFPHKGNQDFFAALFIWIRLTATLMSGDVHNVIKDINGVLTKNSIPCNSSLRILDFVKKVLMEVTSKNQQFSSPGQHTDSSTTTQGFESDSQDAKSPLDDTSRKEAEITRIILEEISMLGLLPEMAKFQNTFVSLLGIFYMNSSSNITDETKKEVMRLLEKSGVKGKDAWLDILNSVRCDAYVATFISKQPEIMEGDVVINDSTLFPYISLMKTLDPSLKEPMTLCIDLDVKGDLTGAEDLLELISLHEFKVKRVVMTEDNFTEYTKLLKSLTKPLKDSHSVNTTIQLNRELLELKELMIQIKRNSFLVKILEVKECHINDAQTADFMSVLKCLPLLSDDACQTTINIEVKGDLIGAEDMLELISNHHLKVRNILISDENIANYIRYMKALKIPLRDPQAVNISIYLKRRDSIAELFHEVKKSGYSIKVLRIETFEVNDSNLSECVQMLESIPLLLDNANQTNIDIRIKKNWVGAETLLTLLNVHAFRVSLLITSDNVSFYTSVLKATSDPWVNGQKVQVHIDADEDLVNVTDLMEEIKKKNFSISMLKLKDIHVSSSNVNEVSMALKLLPHISANVNKTNIFLDPNISMKKTDRDDLDAIIMSKKFTAYSKVVPFTVQSLFK